MAPQPAAADPFGFLRRLVGPQPVYRPVRPRQEYYRRPSRREDRAPLSSNAEPSARDNRALAILAPPTKAQMVVLKGVIASEALGAVGSADDVNQIGQTASGERARDYTGRVQALIRLFTQKQRSSKEGDITEHAIQQSVNAAYRAANLQRFESFLGENWSTERLRVMIVDRAETDVGPLFTGTNKGLVSMADLDAIIQKAARAVFVRLFETSELLAANRSSALFVQRLYQTHGEAMNGEVRERAERMLMKASTLASAQFDGLIRRDDNAFALRYRTQRIVFDCLSENIEKISSSETGLASTAEIEKRVTDIDATQCAKWVANQIVGADGKLKPQEPMPLRAIWSPAGPRDDPSMYGRASGLL